MRRNLILGVIFGTPNDLRLEPFRQKAGGSGLDFETVPSKELEAILTTRGRSVEEVVFPDAGDLQLIERVTKQSAEGYEFSVVVVTGGLEDVRSLATLAVPAELLVVHPLN